MSAIKERPILFSGPMVRAILDGRKTQTRRVIKNSDHYACLTGDCPHQTHSECNADMEAECPFAKPGDRLWVRETWGLYDESGTPFDYSNGIPKSLPDGFHVSYPADDAADIVRNVFSWKPSIHMPRYASRILLEIVSVRVERLNEISVQDAIEEGVTYKDSTGKPYYPPRKTEDAGHVVPYYAFKALWESINGPRSWDANPWVWVVEFKVLEGGAA